MEQQYNEQMQLALEEVQEKKPFGDIELSSGVILGHKPVSILRLQAVMEQFAYPEVPEVWNEDKGKMEKWDGSELYQQMKQEVDSKRTLAVIDAISTWGTFVKHIPEGIPKPEDENWIEEVELFNLVVRRDSEVARYFAWVKYVALVNEEDITKVFSAFGATLGTSEENVTQQLRTNFPDNT
jgi:hypothetical protein